MASKMKSISRFTGLLNRSKSRSSTPPSDGAQRSGPAANVDIDNAVPNSPEATVVRTIKQFCESGTSTDRGEEVTHLPVIVDAAESSPSAAAAAAQQIRKCLGRDFAKVPYVQYNAIMLIRILSDNPGPSFTRNFDKSFVSTVKELLRNCKDSSTQQILRETLDNLEANKPDQEGLEALINMWRKEKGTSARLSQGYGNRLAPPPNYMQPGMGMQQGNQQWHQNSRRRQLPPPQELASRIEEARNTAKILLQLIQSTPSKDLLNNDLLKEFADRCQSAQKSMQGYIACDAPPPDDDTMLTLIETNEQLSLASTRYQRALLNARKAMGINPSPQTNADGNGASNIAGTNGVYPAPQTPVQTQSESAFASSTAPSRPTEDQSYSAFGSRDETFQPPAGPPPGMMSRSNLPDGQQASASNQPPRLPSLDQPSDPFADPVDQNHLTQDSHPARRPHSHTFSVDAGPQYAPGSNQAEPVSPPRPGPSAYHNSGVTASYLGRQDDATFGTTMHGGQERASEIDGYSEVGRTPRDTDSAYSVSPVQARHAYNGSR